MTKLSLLLCVVALVAVATAKGDHDDDHKYHDRDRKDGKGGCRGKGKHPNGRHGSKGEREGHKDSTTATQPGMGSTKK